MFAAGDVATMEMQWLHCGGRCQMTSVGIRELKNNLSRYLAAVRRGEEVIVTQRGKPVARITRQPGEQEVEPPWVTRMAAAGLLRPGVRRRRAKGPSPMKLRGEPLSKTIIEGRR